jgi:hypothetical protein
LGKIPDGDGSRLRALCLNPMTKGAADIIGKDAFERG